MDLIDLLEGVSDRASFLAFVRALASDAHPGEDWESATIGDFLEAAAAWGEDSVGLPFGLDETASWQGLARFLYAGKIYE